MPNGIAVYVEDGFATIDFEDRSLAGPALAKLIEIGGPDTVEPLTRSGPRRQYRVPEGNAREAGLLDEPASGKRPDRDDLGPAAALASASPDGARPTQPTSTNAFSQTMRAGEYRGAPQEGTYPVDPAAIYGHTSPATTTAPAVEPASGLAPLHRDVIDAVPFPVRVSGDPAPTGTPVGAGSPTDSTAGSNAAPAAPSKYPEGEPSEDWTRKQLDSYAINERGIDTTDKVQYGTKADVVAKLNNG